MKKIYRLIINDNARIFDEDEMIEKIYDEISEIRNLFESLYELNMEILKKHHSKNKEFNISEDDISF